MVVGLTLILNLYAPEQNSPLRPCVHPSDPITAIPYASFFSGYFATVCDFYQHYLEYVDVASAQCTDVFLDALRTVARVGGYYHRSYGNN